MSLVEASQKLKEFIKMVGAADTGTLRSILELFSRFYEGRLYREQLMERIRDAIIESLVGVFNSMKYRVGVALLMFDDFITQFYASYNDIVERGDVNRFVEFLDKVIKALSKEDEYREIVEDLWIDLQEILKEVLGR